MARFRSTNDLRCKGCGLGIVSGEWHTWDRVNNYHYHTGCEPRRKGDAAYERGRAEGELRRTEISIYGREQVDLWDLEQERKYGK